MIRNFLLVCFFLFSFFGCQAPNRALKERAWREDTGRLKVLCTIAMIDDLVAQIGDGYVDTLSLIEGELDPHAYEIVKGDDEKFECASLVFYNGLGLEHGYSLRRCIENHKHAVGVADEVVKVYPEALLLVEGQKDPHLWTDVSLWAQIIPVIVDELSYFLPDKRPLFEKRGEELNEQFVLLDQEIYELMQAIPEKKRYLITSHDAFNYFARRYLKEKNEDWKERFCAPEGLSPEAQLSVHELASIIRHMKSHNVQVVFPESNVSGDSLKKLAFTCAHEGLSVTVCSQPLYGDAMGPEGGYIAMMRHNGSTIARELLK